MSREFDQVSPYFLTDEVLRDILRRKNQCFAAVSIKKNFYYVFLPLLYRLLYYILYLLVRLRKSLNPKWKRNFDRRSSSPHFLDPDVVSESVFRVPVVFETQLQYVSTTKSHMFKSNSNLNFFIDLLIELWNFRKNFTPKMSKICVSSVCEHFIQTRIPNIKKGVVSTVSDLI